MRRETWDRLEALFFDALDLPAEARPSFLDRACAGDAELRRELDAMLAAHLAEGGTASAGRRDRAEGPAAPALAPGTRVGAWEIEARIGQGGMGEVYRARRADAQYEQVVAIKLTRAGTGSEDLMRRFRRERQILARLEHPNIATLLDGGVTGAGQPYFVMQHVDGAPITRWAAERDLPLEELLRLFLVVCDAVHFAHAKLVVHRDLKPGNILVTRDGDVRLLDFGIAKLLDVEPWGGSSTGDLLLLTPEHAAPEQFLGDAITTATDVYGLGVLLYELLAGSRPFQFTPPLKLARVVCVEDPPPPSEAATDPARLADAGLHRPPVPPQDIAGDLDSIVMQALRKEPDRRYASVADLADDVRRYLNGFPVRARPETLRYVAARFVRRHRVGVAASAALALALLALVAVSLRFAATSEAQARRIAVERDVALEVSSFLENLFRSPDPFAAGRERRDTLRIRDFLAEGTRKVQEELDGQPLVQARLLTVLGRAHADLGMLDAARPLLEEAVAIRRNGLGPDAIETASSERSLASVLWQLGELPRAESLFHHAAASFARDSLAAGEERIRTLNGLGNTLQTMGRYPEAEAVYRQALALAEAHYAPDHSDLAGRISDLATVLRQQARLDEAEPLLRRALDIERRANGADHIRVAGPLNNLGIVLMDRHEYAEAETVFREAVDIARTRLPAPHPRTAVLISNLAAARLNQGRVEESEALLREALDMRRALFGDRHIDVAGTLLNLAATIDAHGPGEEALEMKEEALDILLGSVGPDHPLIATAHQNIGVSNHLLGRHEQALASFEAAITVRRVRLGESHPLTANVLSKAGQCLLDLGRHDEAERRFLEAYAAYEPIREAEAEQWNHLLGEMARLYRTTGRAERSERYEAMRLASGTAGK